MTEDDLEFHAWPLRSVGGQHVGPIGYGALVVHKPTGIAVACESERSQHGNKQKAMEKLRAVLERAADWSPGPPPGRGLWWIVWRGVVRAVAVDPALIYRDDPNARLLLKTMTGLAYPFATESGHITYHAAFSTPEAP